MIKLVKMITGEELIADVVSEDAEAGTVSLKNPVVIVLSDQGAGMMPFSPFSEDDTFEIKGSAVICTSNPDQEIKNAYNKQFGSGIIAASRPLDLGI